jgi:hypothetical protein
VTPAAYPVSVDFEPGQATWQLGYRINRIELALRAQVGELRAEVKELRSELAHARDAIVAEIRAPSVWYPAKPFYQQEADMVLTKPELLASFQNEVRILDHLASKVDRSKLDYRPTPKQRSTLELLQYLSMMGPELIKAAKVGVFEPPVWTAAEQAVKNQNFDQTMAAIAAQKQQYASLLNTISDADMRAEITMFGSKTTRGSFIVNSVLSGCAAYRTQLFLYLKACGHEELSTMNLWAGMDAPAAV